jgi:hypothetical protein
MTSAPVAQVLPTFSVQVNTTLPELLSWIVSVHWSVVHEVHHSSFPAESHWLQSAFEHPEIDCARATHSTPIKPTKDLVRTIVRLLGRGYAAPVRR